MLKAPPLQSLSINTPTKDRYVRKAHEKLQSNLLSELLLPSHGLPRFWLSMTVCYEIHDLDLHCAINRSRQVQFPHTKKMHKKSASSLNEEKLREAAQRNDLGLTLDLLARKTNPNSRNEVRDFSILQIYGISISILQMLRKRLNWEGCAHGLYNHK